MENFHFIYSAFMTLAFIITLIYSLTKKTKPIQQTNKVQPLNKKERERLAKLAFSVANVNFAVSRLSRRARRNWNKVKPILMKGY